MKKTLTINLSGVVFNIDEDAYDTLKEYLAKLETKFENEEGKEVMNDIEARLAELFGEGLQREHKNVVTIEQVERAIEQLGTAEEIGGGTNDIEKEEPSKNERKRHRKFYRDSENKVLGGVAAGLAAYLGFDVTIVRLIFVLLAITIFGWLIPIYLLVWLIAPEAKTTAQKLEMQGIEPSIENIKEYLNSEKFKESAGKIGSRLGDVVMWLFRIAAIIVGLVFIVIGAFVIGALIVALVGIIVGGGSALGVAMSGFMPMSQGNNALIIFITSTLVACLIPIVSIIIATARLIRRDKTPRKKGWGWFWFIVWIVAVIVSINSLILNVPNVVNALRNWEENDFVLLLDEDIVTEERLRGVMFNEIEIDEAMNVHLVTDTCNYIEVKGLATNMRNTKVAIEEGKLKIGSEMPIEQLNKKQKIMVHYCSELHKIEVGNASVLSNYGNILTTSNLELDIASAAVVSIGVKCSKLDIDASSAAVVNVWGECEMLEAKLASATVVNMKDLKANSAVIDASPAAVVDAPRCENIKD